MARDATTGRGSRYFESQGFEVVHGGPAGLPSDPQAIRPGELHDWILTRVPERAEAVFIGGNGLRAVGVRRWKAPTDRS
jgi:maleate isomerase